MSADVRRYLDILTESNSLSEGVYDPHIFKAVFIIGPPGAGKSTTARKLLDNTGLRRINIDDFSEMMIKKGQSQLGSLSPEQWEQAWQKSQSRKELALHGRLGLVIDSTGSDSKRILSAAKQLENIGYEIMLILVTASFDTVLQRQKQREQEQIKKWGTGRKVDQGYAKLVYDSVRSNIKTYENKFGNIQWLGMPPAEYEITSVGADYSRLSRKQWPTIAERSNIRFIGINTDETESSNLSFAESIVERFLNIPPSDSEALRWIEKQKKSKIEPKDVDKTLYAEYDLNDKLKENAMDAQFFRKYADLIKEAEENEETHEVDIHEIANNLKFLPTTKKAKKYKFVKNGAPGKLPPMSYAVSDKEQPVVTVTSDGKETQNVAAEGDIIMSGPSAENYVVKAAKFPKLYQGSIGGDVIPEQSPRMVAQVDDLPRSVVHFTAPWGESMALRSGDYLVKDGDQGYYRIARAEYEETYNPPGK